MSAFPFRNENTFLRVIVVSSRKKAKLQRGLSSGCSERREHFRPCEHVRNKVTAHHVTYSKPFFTGAGMCNTGTKTIYFVSGNDSYSINESPSHPPTPHPFAR